MKTISLTQPWATLLATGAKRIETRSWPPPRNLTYQQLAIHASKGMPGWARDCCDDPDFADALYAAGYDVGDVNFALPRGVVLATATFAGAAKVPEHGRLPVDINSVPVGPDEAVFGDCAPGRWLWAFRDVVLLPEPVPARGMLGLWEWEPPVLVVPDPMQAELRVPR